MPSPASADSQTIRTALPDLAAWTAWLHAAETPVLAETADALERLRANVDSVDANGIGETIASDPLMTLKVLAHASKHRSPRAVTGSDTAIAALVMMGISPFFAAFGPQPTVEARLVDRPAALAGFRKVLVRSHRGANFALAFAVHRLDPNAAVVHAAALLHGFAELLLWCHAPELALAIAEAQRLDRALRSSAIELRVLNVTLADLQRALMQSWGLPSLLSQVAQEAQRETSSVRTVELAARLARHTADGWDNPALPDDVADVARLLNISTTAALQLVRTI